MGFDQSQHAFWNSAFEQGPSEDARTSSKFDHRCGRRRNLRRDEIGKRAAGRSNRTNATRVTNPGTQECHSIPDRVFLTNLHHFRHFQPPCVNLAAHEGRGYNRGDSFATVTERPPGPAQGRKMTSTRILYLAETPEVLMRGS